MGVLQNRILVILYSSLHMTIKINVKIVENMKSWCLILRFESINRKIIRKSTNIDFSLIADLSWKAVTPSKNERKYWIGPQRSASPGFLHMEKIYQHA